MPTNLPPTEPIIFNEGIAFRGSRIANFHFDEPSIAWIDYSDDERQELGSYQGTIPRDKLERLQRDLTASRYKALAERGQVVAPDSLSVLIMEGSEGASFTKPDIPKEIEPVLMELRFLLDWLRQYPLATLRASAAWIKNPISVRDPLQLKLRFESVGVEPVRIANPFRPETGLGLLKMAVSSDTKNWVYADLNESNRVIQQAAPEGDEITLAPQQTWEVVLRKSMHLTPGLVQVQLKYDSNLDEAPDSPNLAGQLPIKLPDLVVRK